MEEIYTVHIKCRPDAAHSYPSERSYSSSTVGGLALTHFIISVLVTILTSALYCAHHIWIGELINGSSLIIGALFCSIAGFLASTRWYIDRNIRWFFIASIISTICSITSLSLMVYLIVKPTFDQHSFIFYFISKNRTEQITLSNTTIGLYSYNNQTTVDSEVNVLNREIQSEDLTFQIELYIHLFLSALVELTLSMFSVKIGWKGMKNRSENTSKTIINHGKHMRPDILEAHKNYNFDPKLSHYSNVVKELYKLQKSNMFNDNIISKLTNDNHNKLNLPLPESQKEYRERIEKFLSASNDDC